MSRFEMALGRLSLDGEVTLADGWSDPEGARAALTSRETALVLELEARAVLGEAAEFGPFPSSPLFARVGEGGELTIASARRDASKAHAKKVVVRHEPRAWGAGASSFERSASEITVVLAEPLELERGAVAELSFAGVFADDAQAGARILFPLASALASRLEVEVEGASGEPASASPVRSKLRAADAARFSLGFEGDKLVLRDHESDGPRAGAGRHKLIALSCLVPALASLATFAFELRAFLTDPSASVGLLLGPLALGLVLGVAAYAFFEIARFADRYSADSEPLAWFGDDRVVVAPWVSRDGAIDTRPGGRFGTAIRTSEITGTTVQAREARHAVVLEGAHGPFDVLLTDDPDTARHFAALIERLVKSVASPEKRRTALLRAQERRDKRVSAAEA